MMELWDESYPGYGFAKGPIEERESWKKLIESYFLENENLKGIILLLDCRREPNNDDKKQVTCLHVHMSSAFQKTRMIHNPV